MFIISSASITATLWTASPGDERKDWFVLDCFTDTAPMFTGGAVLLDQRLPARLHGANIHWVNYLQWRAPSSLLQELPGVLRSLITAYIMSAYIYAYHTPLEYLLPSMRSPEGPHSVSSRAITVPALQSHLLGPAGATPLDIRYSSRLTVPTRVTCSRPKRYLPVSAASFTSRVGLSPGQTSQHPIHLH